MGLEANDSNVSTVENTENVTDNSEVVDNHEPLGATNDNSEEITNKEPENNQENSTNDNAGQSDNNSFKTLEEANKGYAELRKLMGQQSNELGELRKYKEKAEAEANEKAQKEAQDNGFDSVQSYQNHKEVAKFTADEYAKHISECEYPDEMEKLLNEYRSNPSDEVLDLIESQFSLETIKNVAGKNEIFKGQLQDRENETLADQVRQSAQMYLDEYVTKYSEEFNNPAFAALFGEAFRAYGCDLNADKFVEYMRNFAQSVIKDNGIKTGINRENVNATDEIAGTSFGGSTSNNSNNGRSLLQMSEKDLDKRLSELI